jgi:hypothetical protein
VTCWSDCSGWWRQPGRWSGVDGTGLTLAHEDGRPRWVAVSDAAMELLEQIQHDFGEGPCLPPSPRTG